MIQISQTKAAPMPGASFAIQPEGGDVPAFAIALDGLVAAASASSKEGKPPAPGLQIAAGDGKDLPVGEAAVAVGEAETVDPLLALIAGQDALVPPAAPQSGAPTHPATSPETTEKDEKAPLPGLPGGAPIVPFLPTERVADGDVVVTGETPASPKQEKIAEAATPGAPAQVSTDPVVSGATAATPIPPIVAALPVAANSDVPADAVSSRAAPPADPKAMPPVAEAKHEPEAAAPAPKSAALTAALSASALTPLAAAPADSLKAPADVSAKEGASKAEAPVKVGTKIETPIKVEFATKPAVVAAMADDQSAPAPASTPAIIVAETKTPPTVTVTTVDTKAAPPSATIVPSTAAAPPSAVPVAPATAAPPLGSPQPTTPNLTTAAVDKAHRPSGEPAPRRGTERASTASDPIAKLAATLAGSTAKSDPSPQPAKADAPVPTNATLAALDRRGPGAEAPPAPRIVPLANPAPIEPGAAVSTVAALRGADLIPALRRERAAAPILSAQGEAIIAAPATTPTTVEPVAEAQQPALDMQGSEWVEEMIDTIEMLRDARAQGGAATTRLRLTPDALGTIEVVIGGEADALDVRIQAESPAARALLADAAPRLLEMAESRGLKLGQSSIDAGGQGQRHADQQPQHGSSTRHHRHAAEAEASSPQSIPERIA